MDLVSRLQEDAPRRQPYAADFRSPTSSAPWIVHLVERQAETLNLADSPLAFVDTPS